MKVLALEMPRAFKPLQLGLGIQKGSRSFSVSLFLLANYLTVLY